ncbi:hypothetical protein C7999DRAFT_35313 [Corynascus novoguineensis]|uniref:Uncharacterized protein n=1 Tax=Corynascus novoguineensis TaxID=1126955 RepID=A0AAN7CN76_9PEZI|nr:hypothetical protein C7999DRAFT_35313 [Corynascus novoguineensis]
MRCIVAPGGGQSRCSRCQVAEVPCHYSVPRKPGRPPTKPPGALVQGLVVSSETALSSKSASTTEDTTRVEDRLSQQEPLSRTESFPEFAFDVASWPFLSFPDELVSQSDAPLSSSETGYTQGTWVTEHDHHQFSQFGTTLPTPQLPPTPLTPPRHSHGGAQTDDPAGLMHSGTHTPTDLEGGQRYMQCLSDFNVRLSRAVELGLDVSSIHVEQAAAHVLESSAIFLSIVNLLQSSGRHGSDTQEGSRKRHRQRSNTHSSSPAESRDGHDSHDSCNQDDASNSNSKNSNSHDRCAEDGDAAATALPTGPFAPDMATVLQLVVFSMRLTELHHELYSAVYRYLQRYDSVQHTVNETNTSFPACAEAAGSLPPLSVSLSVAGVALAPHPRFQLELMLQAGAHYLGRIQEAVNGLKALRPDVSGPVQLVSQRSVSGALLVRMLMMQDQQGRMSAIREVLAKLRDEFGIVVRL